MIWCWGIKKDGEMGPLMSCKTWKTQGANSHFILEKDNETHMFSNIFFENFWKYLNEQDDRRHNNGKIWKYKENCTLIFLRLIMIHIN